jgi:formate/nitrite transporter FocA (FNT family)
LSGRKRDLKRGYFVVYAQFGLIFLFIYGLSAEYRSNAYQQDWVSNNAPWLQYFLNGYLAAMLLGIFIGGGVLLAADYWRTKDKKSSLRTIG